MKQFFKELWAYMSTRKRYWLLPVTILLVLLVALAIRLQFTTVAPFIYTVY